MVSTWRDEKVARCVSLHLTLSVAQTNQAIRYEMVAEMCISAILSDTIKSVPWGRQETEGLLVVIL